MESIIQKLEANIETIFKSFDDKSRGYAWYDLNDAFGNKSLSEDQKAKELFIYLANWGMVARGSFLMKHTWRILKPVIEILSKPEYKELRNPEIETVEKSIDLLIELRDEIYKSLRPYHDDKTVSYTLISKILLGTLGCTIAYDRNVKIVLSATGIASKKFEPDSINSLCEYYNQNKTELETLRKKVEKMPCKKCPSFKLLDLVLWSAADKN
ncbi:hypothetical protein [uncultured Treponema sp.]|uniref:hypothetical protein n=1 Tax=uncultured Treponema sp. TaxID=162155 RepID=UPI00260EEFE4|nr:hypothetical protein [uncultured Treponema sp.]